jgi:multiple sugar transport system permease protein
VAVQVQTPTTGATRITPVALVAGRRLTLVQRQRLALYAFLVPAAIFVAVFYLYPIAYNARMSVQEFTARSFVTGEAPFVGLDNFRRLFSFADFRKTAVNSVIFTAGSLFFQFTIGLALALFFQKRFPLNTLLRSLLLLPWLLPVLVSGAIWRRLFDLDYGVVNFGLRSLGVVSEPIPWLTSAQWALLSVLIANIWIGIPFNMIVLHAGLTSIPAELYEAASIDGAGPWQRFHFLTWPLLRPVTTVVLVLGVIYTLRVFDVIMAITGGGPGNASHTLNTWGYQLSFTRLDFGLGAAVGDILIVVSMIFGVIYLRSTHRQFSAAASP